MFRSGHAADKLFHKMSPPDAASYAALICGRAQFGHIEGANKMFKEALDSNLILPVEVFNKIIGGAEVLKESHELRWSFIEVDNVVKLILFLFSILFTHKQQIQLLIFPLILWQ